MIASNSECNYKGKLSENMLCAGAKGKDACIGASGGPAIGASGGPAIGASGGPATGEIAAGHHKLLPVVSWGTSCALVSWSPSIHHCSINFVQDGLYEVYLELTKLQTWID